MLTPPLTAARHTVRSRSGSSGHQGSRSRPGSAPGACSLPGCENPGWLSCRLFGHGPPPHLCSPLNPGLFDLGKIVKLSDLAFLFCETVDEDSDLLNCCKEHVKSLVPCLLLFSQCLVPHIRGLVTCHCCVYSGARGLLKPAVQRVVRVGTSCAQRD